MDVVRFGVIGLGNMGTSHCRNFMTGKVEDAILTAVCDIDTKKLTTYKEQNIATFDNIDDMLSSGLIDCLLIAVPHYLHPEYAIKAMNLGIHVIVEKPTGVYTKQVKEMNAVADKTGVVFSGMFCNRTSNVFKAIKEIIDRGDLGDIKRVNWIATDWYRTQSYYNSSNWRATWAGEGGGVLLNQCPHNLDMLVWLTGMLPKKVTAKCYFGKWHDIEVEDDVSAFFEYENGATGVFITSTADIPGTNRLEILGDKGKIVFDKNTFTFYKLSQSEREFNANFVTGFGAPTVEEFKSDLVIDISRQHADVCQNVAKHILGKEELFIDGREGINQCQLSNAMLLSAWKNKTVELPINDEEYWEELQKHIKTSKAKNNEEVVFDLDGSFGTH